MMKNFRVRDKARNVWLPETENSLHAFTDFYLTFGGHVVGATGSIEEPTKVEFGNLDWTDYKKPISITKEEDRFVVLQFIGMKDKNDHRIFEGDILDCMGVKFVVEYGVTRRTIGSGVNKYDIDIPCFYFKNTQSGEHVFPISETAVKPHDLTILEIVGNIFDNPELLNIKEDTDCQT